MPITLKQLKQLESIYHTQQLSTIKLSSFPENSTDVLANHFAFYNLPNVQVMQQAIEDNANNTYPIMHQDVIELIKDFSWFKNATFFNKQRIINPCNQKFEYKGIDIYFSTNNPQSLSYQKNNKLLVVQFAWDSGSFVGNEYWDKLFTDSGDPAAACCSQIPCIQNPLINSSNVSGDTARIADPKKDFLKTLKLQPTTPDKIPLPISPPSTPRW